METVRAEFAGEVRPGDVVVAGKNFGCGSSREQAPEALRHLGVAAVIAKSFARTFYRNAMNLGLPAVVCRAAEAIPDGARLRLSIDQGVIEDLDSGRRYDCDAIPPHLMSMLNDGGLLGHLKRRLQAGELSESAR
jgi:3-isopropylmalate/(R)-2-methylmalate dehydratase small subunit